MIDRILRHADILPPGTAIHMTRAALTPTRPRALHGHDFVELFWVQNGRVRHHLRGGTATLTEGTLVLLRPGLTHALQGRGDAALVVSLALHPDLVASLDARLPPVAFWQAQDGPAVIRRDIRQMADLNAAARRLEHSRRDALAAEAFILPLLSDLSHHDTGLPPDAPGWLTAACAAAQTPEVYRDGAAGLVAQTGQTHPHVSRSLRRWLGQTPTDYVNTIRMTQAARALTTDNDPLAVVAEGVGLANLSHFHKLFRAHHGMTPLQYRQQFQRDVVQPGLPEPTD
ncbi:transcriptional regulator, AraC family [Loktanella fryxellensis]|uniref:Transcriptional regulator, AraC family n=1 Tax=Loktanella fryxellensis TaxID=245187 RepID=A0A1H8CW60_9RHOB|nr:AraC family transcriptional regulator [Loktanella fryxellensis]SEM98407.1 transcriptional regulator, AraC family [Loktanella fryxellensis]